MNIKNLIEDFRDDLLLYDDEDIPDNSIIRLLNRAGEHLTDLDAYCIERRYSIAAVANTPNYDLPGDFYDGKFVLVDNDERTRKIGISEMMNAKVGLNTTGDPYSYAFWEDDLWVYNVPGSSATTSTLNGALTSSSTSIVLNDASEFPNRGCVKIDDEKIYFESKSGNTLSVLTRGVEDTVAASHSDASTVTWHNIELFYFARYRDFLYAPETGVADTASGGSNLDAGRHYLMWTYYDNARGLESYPRDLYSITTTSGQRISMTNLVDAPDMETFQKRIYTTKAGCTQPFYLVTTLSQGTTSYNIDSSDATLGAASSFDWDSVGGDNLPKEMRMAQLDWAISRYLKRSKRFGEAAQYEMNSMEKFIKAVKAIRRRRNVAAKARTPDIVL